MIKKKKKNNYYYYILKKCANSNVNKTKNWNDFFELTKKEFLNLFLNESGEELDNKFIKLEKTSYSWANDSIILESLFWDEKQKKDSMKPELFKVSDFSWTMEEKYKKFFIKDK